MHWWTNVYSVMSIWFPCTKNTFATVDKYYSFTESPAPRSANLPKYGIDTLSRERKERGFDEIRRNAFSWKNFVN